MVLQCASVPKLRQNCFHKPHCFCSPSATQVLQKVGTIYNGDSGESGRMESEKQTGKLDMKHGFMKSIIRNQVDRDNYDKEVKASKPPTKRGFLPNKNHHVKKPDLAVYIPPWRKEAATEQDSQPEQTEEASYSSEEEVDQGPRTLFTFEFEDKDGKIYKQYVKEGVRAELLAQRMGYDRRLAPGMVKALQQRLQEEIDKQTKKRAS